MKKNDLLLIIFVILAALFGLGGWNWYRGSLEGERLIAVISQNNQVIEKINLDNVREAREIEIGGNYHEIILVEKGRIRFKQADCPDKICVNTGWLERPGDMAVCLPNRAVVKVEAK